MLGNRKPLSFAVFSLLLLGGSPILMKYAGEPTGGVFPKAGYHALRLTLDHHVPGGLYTVEELTDSFATLHPTCEMNPTIPDYQIQVFGTADIEEDIERRLSAGFTVAPENWSRLNLQADLNAATKVRAIYSDSKVELVSSESIKKILDNFLKRETCQSAIIDDLMRGYQVCQTQAVIVSDLVYEVTSASASSLGLIASANPVIATELAGSSERFSVTRLRGGKLYHAVKLRRSKLNKCILLNTDTAVAPRSAFDRMKS